MDRGMIRFSFKTLVDVFKLENSDAWESVHTLPKGCQILTNTGSEIPDVEYPLHRTLQTGEVVRGEEVRIMRADGTLGAIRYEPF